MADKPEANLPVVHTADAVKDVEAVLGFVLKRRNLPRINLMGWSWGCTIMATTTTRNPDKVARLTLYAPPWIRTTPSLLNAGPGPLGAYRMVTQEQAKTRWLTGVPEHKKAEQIPAGWFEQWTAATWATDPVGAQQNPPVIRAPNGTVADSADYWLKARPYYDPAKVTVPTLVVVGEWDHDTPPYMAQALFPLLINAPGKRMVTLPEATHTMMLEKNRMMLFRTVQAFLDEAGE
jgi:pimeloyl-ACP methyl ester carboxylesterase